MPKLWLLTLTTVAACGTPVFTPHMPPSLQEAASIHVAVLSIAPWSAYESALQPDMSVTVQEAENMALPVTSDYVRNVYDAFNGKLQVGWGSAKNIGAANQGSATGDAAASETGTAGGGGGGAGGGKGGKGGKGGAAGAAGASDASAPGPASAASAASAAGTANDSVVGTAPTLPVQTNPLMQHELALSIFQEMQILSRYLKDAAFKKGWEPYVVRAQVSVSPYAHYQPFDVYVDLGLFTSCLDGKGQPVPDPQAPTQAATQTATQAAMVIPLLVTDSIEAQQASNTAQLARDLALGLGGNIGNVALQGSLEKVSKNLQSILGADYNSLYMVSRVSDSVMQVRLGAPVNAMSQYSMSTVTHNVTMVVLTPRCYPGTDHTQLNIATVSRLRNALSGQVLDVDLNYGVAQARKVMERVYPTTFQSSRANDPKVLADLVGYIKFNDYSKFVQLLGKKGLDIGYSQVVWTALGDVGGTTEFNVAHVDLPAVAKGSLTSTNQIVYVQDGSAGSAVTVNIDPDLMPVTQSAQLLLANGNMVLLANSISATNGGRTLQILFPSLAPLRALPGNLVPTKAGRLQGTLILQPAIERWDDPKAVAASEAKGSLGAQSNAPLEDQYAFSSLLYLPAPPAAKGASTPAVNKPVQKTARAKKVAPVAGAGHARAAPAKVTPAS